MTFPTYPAESGSSAAPPPTAVQDSRKSELADRALQLLSYLKGLHRIRHPRDLDAVPSKVTLAPQLPNHEAVRLRPEPGVLLEVHRVDLPERATVPSNLEDRLVWEEAADRPRLRADAASSDRLGNAHEDTDRHHAAFEDWLSGTWLPWSRQNESAFAARRLFLDLYDLRLGAERDAATHEAVWVHGVAVGTSAKGELVRQPLFVQPVRYDLDDRSGALRVVSTGDSRLEIDPFERLVDAFDVMKRIETELNAEFLDDAGNYDDGDDDDDAIEPSRSLLGPNESEILERLSKVVVDSEYVPGAETIPTRSPRWRFADIEALYHRLRPIRYEAYFEALGRAIEDGYLPDTWSAILADEPTTAPISERVNSNNSTWASLDQRIFSPVPLNVQQTSVLNKISNNAGVTVQGPPGTGKSYTIAALTSHFLAHGLRVLICAEKPHPLTVVREKMPTELQELCVAVLGDDRAAKQQLEASVSAITAKVNAVDQARDQRELDDLDEGLDKIRRQLSDLRDREMTIRMAEQEKVTVDGVEYGTADVGRYLRSHRSDDWLPDRIGSEVACPLQHDDIEQLLHLTRQLSIADREAFGRRLLPVNQLPSGEDLEKSWERLSDLDVLASSASGSVQLDELAKAPANSIQELIADLRTHREMIQWSNQGAWSAIYQAIMSSESQRDRWQELVRWLTTEAESALKLGMQVAAHHVSYPSELDGRDVQALLAELRRRFAEGRGLPRLGGGDLKALMHAITIDGRRPATTADLDLVQLSINRDTHRRQLWTYWHNEIVRYGLPPLDSDRPEDDFQTNYQEGLKALVELPARSHELGLRVDRFVRGLGTLGDLAVIDFVVKEIETGLNILDRNRLKASLESYESGMKALVEHGHPTTRAIHGALERQDRSAWEAALAEIRRLNDLEPQLRRHAELATKLAAVAPNLAAALRSTAPGFSTDDLARAWRWKRLRAWLDRILGLGNLAEVSVQITAAEQEEQRLLAKVVARRAWLQMARRTTGAQRSALETWAQAMARVGKGTGKHAPRHRLTAQRAMQSAQNAVPVWIMSIAQAIDSFRPDDDLAFDVVIVDEASQAPIDTIAVLGLGQRVLVVGDDKQISPSNFSDETEANRLRKQHLVGIPDADGFDIRTSLYDTATRRFPGVIQLQEHFRCLPEIIAFSNDLAYDGRIDPLRERHRDPDWQPVRSIRVPGGYREAMSNIPEAEAVVKLVAEVIADPAFAHGTDYPNGATIGIVTMIGQDQGKLIQNMLMEMVPLDEMEARRIRVGSPYEFQGDERDIIIISLIDAVMAVGKISGRRASSKKEQQSYNVAASRARDQLIVVHSFDPAALDPSDFRRQLVAFAQEPRRVSEVAADLRDGCESRFERDVLERLLKLGVRVDGQYPVAGYRLDFTLTDLHGRRVAVECDGDSYHGIDQLRDDTNRQRTLERLGWRFARIRASEFYADPDGSFAALVRRAEEHGLDLVGAR